jgi:F-type H+-transporting ATPase subunit b
MFSLLAVPLQEEHASGGPLSVDPGLMIWTVFVFLVLLLILKRFAYPALLGAVEAREKRLEEQIAAAERARTEAEAILAEQKKLLAEGRTVAHQLLADARSTAENERALALEKTKAEQEELLARARRDIAEERDRAVSDLRREAVELSLAAASKLIGKRLDSDSDRKLVEEYLAGVESRR